MSENVLKLIGLIIAIAGLVFGFLRLLIMWRKDKIDQRDFKNKKINFSVYIQDAYRLYNSDLGCKFLLFNITIYNRSAAKITLLPFMNIKLKDRSVNGVRIKHDKSLFLKDYHDQIEKLDNTISIEERGIKSGWVIARIPDEIASKRIDKVEIALTDSSNQQSRTEYYLLRDIVYENKNE